MTWGVRSFVSGGFLSCCTASILQKETSKTFKYMIMNNGTKTLQHGINSKYLYNTIKVIGFEYRCSQGSRFGGAPSFLQANLVAILGAWGVFWIFFNPRRKNLRIHKFQILRFISVIYSVRPLLKCSHQFCRISRPVKAQMGGWGLAPLSFHVAKLMDLTTLDTQKYTKHIDLFSQCNTSPGVSISSYNLTNQINSHIFLKLETSHIL